MANKVSISFLLLRIPGWILQLGRVKGEQTCIRTGVCIYIYILYVYIGPQNDATGLRGFRMLRVGELNSRIAPNTHNGWVDLPEHDWYIFFLWSKCIENKSSSNSHIFETKICLRFSELLGQLGKTTQT